MRLCSPYILRRVHFHRQADSLILGSTFSLMHLIVKINKYCSIAQGYRCCSVPRNIYLSLVTIGVLLHEWTTGPQLEQSSLEDRRAPAATADQSSHFLSKQGGKRRQKITRIIAEEVRQTSLLSGIGIRWDRAKFHQASIAGGHGCFLRANAQSPA